MRYGTKKFRLDRRSGTEATLLMQLTFADISGLLTGVAVHDWLIDDHSPRILALGTWQVRVSKNQTAASKKGSH
jgi:hypothetical protein